MYHCKHSKHTGLPLTRKGQQRLVETLRDTRQRPFKWRPLLSGSDASEAPNDMRAGPEVMLKVETGEQDQLHHGHPVSGADRRPGGGEGFEDRVSRDLLGYSVAAMLAGRVTARAVRDGRRL